MGLFDRFTKEGKFNRHVRRMSDRDAQPEDREASARFLADDASPKAIMGLLTRFDITITGQSKDRAEKEFTLGLLRGLGAETSRPVRAWMAKCKSYAFPLRLMLEVEGDTATVEQVFEVLDGPAGKDAFEPGRRKELLVWLSDHPHPDAMARVGRFLDDFDEEVRYATAEVFVAQEDDAAREPLLKILANPEEESLRLKHRLATVFQSRGWSIAGAELEGKLPDGFAVRGDRIARV